MEIHEAIEKFGRAEDKMQDIIDRHMNEAYAEIWQEFGTGPTSVSIDIIEEANIGERFSKGHYQGCTVRLGGR